MKPRQPKSRRVFRLSNESYRKLRRTMQRRFSVMIAAFLVGLSVLASCSKVPDPPLRVAANLWPGYETLYLARSLGYYDNTPIQLVDFPSGTEEMRAFRNRNVEAAGISLDQALALAETNPDVQVITIMDFSEGGDVILARPENPNLKALKGKSVGVEATALGAYVLTRALEQVDMSVKDIQVVSLGLSEHERAFKYKTVDAVVTFDPVRSKLLALGARQLFDSSQIPGEIVDVLVVRNDIIESQPDAVQKLVEGRFRALDYLDKNPQDAARRIAPRSGVTPAEFLASLEGLRSPSLQENQKLLAHEDPSFTAAAKRLAQIMIENNLLSEAADLLPLLNDRFVKAVHL